MHYRRWGISIENLTYFFISKNGRKYSHDSYFARWSSHSWSLVFLLGIWLYFLLLREVVNIPIQTLMISPWLLSCKMMISQLELGPRWFTLLEFITTRSVTPVCLLTSSAFSMWYPRTWSSPTKSLLTSLHSHLRYDLKLFYRNKTFPKRFGRANFNCTSIKTIRSWIVV